MSNQLIDQYLKQFEKTLATEEPQEFVESGSVYEVKDGVVVATGLQGAGYGELVLFDDKIPGMIIDLMEEYVGIIVLGNYEGISTATKIKATGKPFSVGVSESLLGRVLNGAGTAIDGKPLPQDLEMLQVERIAPGVVKRKSVSVPLQTGIKSIDALIPIGRGQRELVIGDRGTGKSTLCIDTILNQKGQDVICIYCAIGQKNAKVAATYELLKSKGADAYTIIVSASASDPAATQYMAPYTATAIGEYFMDKGKDVLIVYDDLTKHAYSYRQISLVLRRPAGREAYPGDVFYLHSRLLERSCRLSESEGGGSMTALPVIETLENDVSAYIPTNVISITDGQIFLETDLFNAGLRPAVNVGVSVSRVGGSAQTKAMKQVAGKLKLDLAQYRELAAFAQFDADLDPETKKFLQRGARAMQILRQGKHSPLDLAHQVAIMWALSQGLLDDIEVAKVGEFEEDFFRLLEAKFEKALNEINETKMLSPQTEEALKKAVSQIQIVKS